MANNSLPACPAASKTPSLSASGLSPDFSDTSRWAQVVVQDGLNAPRFQQGDVLHVDLARNHFCGDSYYAIDMGGQQMVRVVQARPGGLWVHPVSQPGNAFPVARELLTIHGEVMFATTTRRVG